jgi:hypothetical protein
MKTPPASFRLWGLLTLSFAGAACLAEYAWDPRAGWVRGSWDWAGYGFGQFGETARGLGAAALTLLLGCALAAIAVQAILRRCGLSWGSEPGPSQAADYDDKPRPAR